MRLLKWMMVLAMMTALAACNDERSAEEAAEDAEEKTEEVYEDAKEGTSDALDRTQEGAQELADEADEAAEEAKESDAWETTKDRANRAWTATKEYSVEAWDSVRESFRGDMSPEDKQRFDECVARLQRVEGLTKAQAERGCWRMMEEGTREDYYAEKGGSDFWANAMDATSDAWDSTKEGSRKAWDKTKEGSKKAWAATKDYSQEAWGEVKESFKGDMTDEEKQSFDSCVKRLQKEEELTKEQAERGCWRMMEEARKTNGDSTGDGDS